MKKESVMEFVDRRIRQSLIDGLPISVISEDIRIRSTNMSKSLFKEISPEEFEKLLLTNLEEVKSSRLKYTSYYVSHARKRMNDLAWIVDNKKKFPRLSNSQIFNLVKLKEKLQPNLELSV